MMSMHRQRQRRNPGGSGEPPTVKTFCLAYLEKLGRFAIVFSLILLLLVAMLDSLTGYELSFSLFYLLPVVVVTWHKGSRWGLFFALLAGLVWYQVDARTGYAYSNPFIIYWNAAIRFCFFGIVTLLLGALKQAHIEQVNLSRRDGLTGAVNGRYFRELLDTEVERSRRSGEVFSVVYFDLDNFKWVNDHLGHSAGDEALRTVVNHAMRHLRKVDVVARLGGDEFAVLLPETSGEQARVVVEKLRLALLAAMKQKQWPITFSMGVVSSARETHAVDDILGAADKLMYEVKHTSKNDVAFLQL